MQGASSDPCWWESVKKMSLVFLPSQRNLGDEALASQVTRKPTETIKAFSVKLYQVPYSVVGSNSNIISDRLDVNAAFLVVQSPPE